MDYISFTLVKVNGVPIKDSVRNEILEYLLGSNNGNELDDGSSDSIDSSIISIEIQRVYHNSGNRNDNEIIVQIPVGKNEQRNVVSTAVQTNDAECNLNSEFSYDRTPEGHPDESVEEFDDMEPGIGIEEITLRKSMSDDRLGVTVSYSSGNLSESDDVDNTFTEVYISDIMPDSVAARDGRLRQGDQILQVNGKDVSNREDTEHFLAEKKDGVTLLVSRCYYGDEDYFNHPADYYLEPSLNLETVLSPDIVKLGNSGEVPNTIHTNTSSLTNSSSTSSTSSTTSSKLSDATTDSKKSSNKTIPTSSSPQRRPNINIRMIDNHSNIINHSNIKEHIDSVNQEISLLDSRVENILKLTSHHRLLENPHQQQTQVLTTAIKNVHASCSSKVPKDTNSTESDTEHIYETIPEDIEPEPVYCSPYDHVVGDQTLIEEWIRLSKTNASGTDSTNNANDAHGGLKLEINQNCSHKPTNKNMLLTLNGADGNYHRKEKIGTPSETENCQKLYNYPPQPLNNFQPNYHHTQQNHLQTGTLPTADTMYTNVANLQQTMLLQQRLFRQALCQNSVGYPQPAAPTTMINASHKNFTAPNLSQYQFIGSRHELATTTMSSPAVLNTNGIAPAMQSPQNQTESVLKNDDMKMEWKVKRRQDGTRYIVRRPIRNQIANQTVSTSAKSRMKIVHNHNDGGLSTTTEDDATYSETKIGRFWCKEDRKKHLEKSRDRRNRQEYLIAVKNQNLFVEQNQKKHALMSMTEGGLGGIGLTPNLQTIHQTMPNSQQPNGICPLLKRSLRKKTQKVDVATTSSITSTTTIISAMSNTQSTDIKPTPPSIGILSVTTV